MSEPLIPRAITPLAAEILDESPVTVISGARQVGKSTLMRELTTDRDARIVNLDSAIDRNAAIADPDGFAAQYPHGTLAIDEIQRVPELLLALKNTIEMDRRPGRFLITGSSNLLTLKGAEESLAGRAQTITLGGFSQGELRGQFEDFASYAWSLPNQDKLIDEPGYTRRDYLELIMSSSYPEIHQASARNRNRWLRNYVDRVVSKDAAEVTGILYPDRLMPLLQVLAAENASEFLAAHYSRLLDIPVRSVPAYLQALQDVFLVSRIPAWSNNVTARAVSKPKVVFRDSGLAAYLCGVDASGLEHDISSTITGGLLEGFVAAELLKQREWSQTDFALHHYRDSQGREVDLILENRRRELVGIEVKATSSVGRSHFRGLQYLREKAGARFNAGVVLHTGARAVSFGDRLWALPIASLWRTPA